MNEVAPIRRAHCGCGGSTDVHRVKVGVSTPVKTIDTGPDLGKEIVRTVHGLGYRIGTP